MNETAHNVEIRMNNVQATVIYCRLDSDEWESLRFAFKNRDLVGDTLELQSEGGLIQIIDMRYVTLVRALEDKAEDNG